jgi:hypothetical protein
MMKRPGSASAGIVSRPRPKSLRVSSTRATTPAATVGLPVLADCWYDRPPKRNRTRYCCDVLSNSKLATIHPDLAGAAHVKDQSTHGVTEGLLFSVRPLAKWYGQEAQGPAILPPYKGNAVPDLCQISGPRNEKGPPTTRRKSLSGKQCGKQDLNLHDLAATRPSTWRVCQWLVSL